MNPNPLLAPSPLPYGYPQFDLIKPAHFPEAFEQAMAAELREIDAIAGNPEAPTFENTLVALERSGLDLARVNRIFSSLASAHTNPEIDQIDSDMAPRLAAQSDKIHLHAALFARIDAVYQKRATLGLDPESARLLMEYYQDFVRAGAKLSVADKTRLMSLNAEIATLETTFSQNLQKETNAGAIVVDARAELAGLSDSETAATEAAAKTAGKEGKFVITLLNTSGQPALASLENRAVRERLQKASVNRSSQGGANDNRAVISRLVRLRAERASLLGYESHAAYQLEDQTAATVGAVNQLLNQLSPPSVANARKEGAAIQKVIDAEKGGFQLAPWDWDFYSEKVRRETLAFDESQLRPYFELNHVLIDGVFYAATQLYGITFKERHDLPVYEPSVRVFEIFDADGSPLALFLVDYYARSSKRGGAWMNEYVEQSRLLGTKPVIGNHLNIPQPPPGQPTLLTFDEVITAFHEFGHALHGMFSDVNYPRFSGTNVPRDFVEYPSQVNEMWALWPSILNHYAKHYQTGALMPPALLEKMTAARKFNQGFKTTEQIAASQLDQAWHQLKPDAVPAAEEVLSFEAAALKKAGFDYTPVPPRYRSTYFNHVFSGGYSAGYYAYIWSEVLDADSVEWFKKNGGLTRANGDHFRKTLLSRGGSEDAMVLFRNFSGGEPYIQPLLERRGLTPQ